MLGRWMSEGEIENAWSIPYGDVARSVCLELALRWVNLVWLAYDGRRLTSFS